MRRLKKKTYFIIFFIISCFSLLFFQLNKDYYKNLILEKINSSIEHKISFASSEFSFFPYPGIQFNEIDIQSKSNDFKLNSKLLIIYFSWKILYGNLILNSILIDQAELIFDNSKKKEKSEFSLNKLNLQRINSYVQLDEITATDLKIIILDKEIENYKFKKILATQDHKEEVELKLEYISEKGNISFESKINFENDKNNFEGIAFKAKIYFDKFNLLILKDYYKYARQARFDNSNLTGEIIFTKKKNSNDVEAKLNNIEFEKLKFLKTNFYPNLNLSSNLVFKIKEEEILIENLFVKLPNIGVARANGNISYKDIIKLNLYINGEYADVHKILEIVLYSTDLNLPTGPDFYSYIKILTKKAKYQNYNFTNVDLDLNIYNTKLSIGLKNADVLDGKIIAKGEFFASSSSKYDFECLAVNINVEGLIKEYTTDKFLKGSLISNFNFNSNGNNFEDFIKNLKAEGKVEVKNGELLGYANFLKPIFSLGKLMNILGPKGKNSGFQSLSSNFKISNQVIETPNLKMIGVGLDANGSGKINFNRKLDYKINVGFGGIAGKVFFVPILYKGTMPNNFSYIDPLWLGSVYLGTTFLAGPIGTTVGGIAGSTVSEYVRNSFETVKNFFGFGKKKEDE